LRGLSATAELFALANIVSDRGCGLLQKVRCTSPSTFSVSVYFDCHRAIAYRVCTRCRPTPKRTWSRSGRLLSTTENRDSRYRWSVGSHTLRIAGLTLDDAGRYQCNASNSEGYRIYSVNLRVYSITAIFYILSTLADCSHCVISSLAATRLDVFLLLRVQSSDHVTFMFVIQRSSCDPVWRPTGGPF